MKTNENCKDIQVLVLQCLAVVACFLAGAFIQYLESI